MIWKVVLRTTCKHIWKNGRRNMSENKISVGEKVASISASELGKNMVHVSDWNKKILVFVKKFKTTAEIPDKLPSTMLLTARDRARVKMANIMMALTVVGSLCMVFLGKRAVERGESVQKMNLEWHKEYNEQAKKEAEEAAKNKK